jgi:hypothetical protein
MNSILKLIGISILIAIVNVSISNIGYINLIWIMTIVFLLTENENFAIAYAVLGGGLYDIMMHNSIGETSLAVLIGVIVFLIFRALVSGDNYIFRAVSVVLLLVVTFSARVVISILIDGSVYSSIGDFMYWWKYVITHSILVGIFIGIFGGMRGIISSEKKIKIK